MAAKADLKRGGTGQNLVNALTFRDPNQGLKQLFGEEKFGQLRSEAKNLSQFNNRSFQDTFKDLALKALNQMEARAGVNTQPPKPQQTKLTGLDGNDDGTGTGVSKALTDDVAERVRLSNQQRQISEKNLQIARTTDEIEKLRIEAARDILQINYDLTNTLEGETNEIIRGNEQAIARNKILQRELELTNDIVDSRKSQFDEMAAQQEELRNSLTGGPIQQYMKQLQDDLANTEAMVVSLAGTVVSEISSAMSSAITGLIDGTKTAQEAFANMFKQIGAAFIQMATQMIAKALVMKALGILFPGASSGFGSGASAPIFGGSSTFSGAFSSGGFGIGGFANGGMLPIEGVSLVGERGPELAVSSGGQTRIYSNEESRSMLERYSPANQDAPMAMAPAQYSFNTIRIADEEYVSRDQLKTAMNEASAVGAKQGEQRAMNRLRQSRSTRSKLGI